MKKRLFVYSKVVIVLLLAINCLSFSNEIHADDYIEFLWPSDDNKIYNNSEQTYIPTTSKEYVELYYIESNRAEYIDTGIIASNIDKLDIDFSFEKNHLDCILGVFSESQKNLLVQWSTDSEYLGYFGNSVWESNIGDFSKKANYVFDVTNKEVYINGSSKTATIAGGFDRSNLNLSFYLFAINYKGSVARQAKGKIYKAKIWASGSQVRELIPVLTIEDLDKERNYDGVNNIPKDTVCMYDKISDRYFLNIGSGNFKAGPIVETFGDGNKYGHLDYLQSDGSQYIKTDMLPTGKEHFKIDFEPTQNQTSNWAVAGARNGGNGYAIFGKAYDKKRFDCFGKNIELNDTVTISRHSIEYNYLNTKEQIIYDNTTYEITGNSPTDLTYNFALFGINTTGTVDNKMIGRIYSFKEWNVPSGTIKRDYIPVLRCSDEKPGMYDIVNNKFFTNDSGTGEFTYDYSTSLYSLKDSGNDTYKATPVGDYNSIVELTDLGKKLFSSLNLSHTWSISKSTFVSPVHDYNGQYDGLEHTVSIDSIIYDQFGNDVTSDAILRFSDDNGLTYTLDAPPVYINVGDYTIYYQITGSNPDYYETLESSAEVSIASNGTGTGANTSVTSIGVFVIPNTGVK